MRLEVMYLRLETVMMLTRERMAMLVMKMFLWHQAVPASEQAEKTMMSLFPFLLVINPWVGRYQLKARVTMMTSEMKVFILRPEMIAFRPEAVACISLAEEPGKSCSRENILKRKRKTKIKIMK